MCGHFTLTKRVKFLYVNHIPVSKVKKARKGALRSSMEKRVSVAGRKSPRWGAWRCVRRTGRDLPEDLHRDV